MKNRYFYLSILILAIFAGPIYCKSISESFPINASSSQQSIGYLNIHGNYESLSKNSAKWTTTGAGFAFGLKVVYPVYLEAYIDYLQSSKSPAVDTATNNYKNSVHFGGKTVFMLGRYFTVKAGMGLANIVSELNSVEVSANNFEINGAGGLNLPINSVFSLDFYFTYRKIFSTPAISMIGGTAGLLIKFY